MIKQLVILKKNNQKQVDRRSVYFSIRKTPFVCSKVFLALYILASFLSFWVGLMFLIAVAAPAADLEKRIKFLLSSLNQWIFCVYLNLLLLFFIIFFLILTLLSKPKRSSFIKIKRKSLLIFILIALLSILSVFINIFFIFIFNRQNIALKQNLNAYAVEINDTDKATEINETEITIKKQKFQYFFYAGALYVWNIFIFCCFLCFFVKRK